jgi:hypothetical protein
VRRRGDLRYNAEVRLKDAFQSITGKVDTRVKDGVERMAARIAQALAKVMFTLAGMSNGSKFISK